MVKRLVQDTRPARQRGPTARVLPALNEANNERAQPRYFTYLWRNESWWRKAELAREGFGFLEYAASNRFRAAGVGPGSVVFIVTVLEGFLYLGGTIEVAAVLGRDGAARYLGLRPGDLRGARQYIVARPGCEDRFRADLKVDDSIAHGLKFSAGNGGFVYPRLDREGRIDRQTLRNARLLYPGAERPLLELLAREAALQRQYSPSPQR